MWVSRDNEVRRRALQHCRELVVGRQPRDEIVVEARRRVTEHVVPPATSSSTVSGRPPPQGARAQLIRAPGAAVGLAVLEALRSAFPRTNDEPPG